MTTSCWPPNAGAATPLGKVQEPATVPVAVAWVAMCGPPPLELRLPFAWAPPHGPEILTLLPLKARLPSAAIPGLGTAPTMADTSAVAPALVTDRQRTRTRPFMSAAELPSVSAGS